MDEKHIDRTAFVTHHGLFKYTCMALRLKNGPATLQRVMNVIVATVKWEHVLLYIDEIIIFSRTLQEQLMHVDEVLRILM